MSEWYKDDAQKQRLLNLINSEGYVLEDRVGALLSRKYPATCTKQVYEQPGSVDKERVEIDAWLKRSIAYFIFEVKNSAYDWVFLKGPRTDQHFHFIYYTNNGPYTLAVMPSNKHPTNSIVTEAVFEILVDSKGVFLEKQKQKPVHKGKEFPERPSGREIVRPAIKQLLKNLETLSYYELFNIQKAVKDVPYVGLYPILVTNAKLYAFTYDETNVDEKADLSSLQDLSEQPWLVLNYSEILRWDENLRQIINHIGFDLNQVHDSRDYMGSHLKSVFVVNQNHLLDFLEGWL
ncbi:MAG: hypothetical protein Q8K75_04700 [Chlamydiales bacterium]|nr:hypothetical protein [Chlamydiales bacterium]